MFHMAFLNTDTQFLCYNSRQRELDMAKLTAKERRALLDAAKKIRIYKLMQSNGYKRLINKAMDERTKQLLAEISANELSDV